MDCQWRCRLHLIYWHFSSVFSKEDQPYNKGSFNAFHCSSPKDIVDILFQTQCYLPAHLAHLEVVVSTNEVTTTIWQNIVQWIHMVLITRYGRGACHKLEVTSHCCGWDISCAWMAWHSSRASDISRSNRMIWPMMVTDRFNRPMREKQDMVWQGRTPCVEYGQRPCNVYINTYIS